MTKTKMWVLFDASTAKLAQAQRDWLIQIDRVIHINADNAKN